jgi:hypothetical protein
MPETTNVGIERYVFKKNDGIQAIGKYVRSRTELVIQKHRLYLKHSLDLPVCFISDAFALFLLCTIKQETT